MTSNDRFLSGVLLAVALCMASQVHAIETYPSARAGGNPHRDRLRDMDETCSICHDVREYVEGAHGDSLTGVDRLPEYDRGDCLHCHEFDTSYPFYLFQAYGTDIEKRHLCLFCHDGVSAPIPPEGPAAHAESSTIPCVHCHDAHIPDQGGHGGGGGAGCEPCHGHDAGYEYAPGQFSEGRGTFASHSTHTEMDADDLRGPFLLCSACHDTTDYPHFHSGVGDPPYTVATTTVCGNCHSADGAYDGLNDPDSGAKFGNGGELRFNWAEGVYEDSELKSGLENWCIGCHDDVPAYSQQADEGGVYAQNVAGDNTNYGYFVTGHGRSQAAGSYVAMSWQSHSDTGNPPADIASCTTCHEGQPTESHIDHLTETTDRLAQGYENDQDDTNCSNCHPPGTGAQADPQFYTDSEDFEAGSHGGSMCTACHDVHGAIGTESAMLRADGEGLCFQCHTEGMVQNDALANNRPGGYVSADDIQEAFSKAEKHNLGTDFSVNGGTYTLECVSCHNIHVINGRYWDAPDGNRSPVTRFAGNPDGFPVTDRWGDDPGEKMDDFAATGPGSGGWYFSKARGDFIAFDQGAHYQPPRSGNNYEWEFGGDILPDYTTQCLDCHTSRVSDANPPVNWGQPGVECTDNSVDPPDQRIECGAQHGLGAANKPSAWDPSNGLMGSSGNPDPIFNEPGVQRGRGAGHFMRWPYDSAYRHAGINFVMSCTDCHEAHGANRGSMIRERFNVNGNGDCGTGGNSNPDGENCADGGNWNAFCNACHYYYGYQHQGMSCGNASCHEANSIHRIIHVTHSGGTDLWNEPSRPTTTPEIDHTSGIEGSNELTVVFTDSVWTNMDKTGALTPSDFLLTDAGENNPRTIVDVIHNPGDPVATIIMNAPLTAADIGHDYVASRGISVWRGEFLPAGPWTVTIPTCPSEANFQLNEPAGSTTAADESGILVGVVNDPTDTFQGDGFFYGDGVDNSIDFDTTPCLRAGRKLTLEARIRPTIVDDGDSTLIQRVFLKNGANYQMSVWRNNTWVTYDAPEGVASIAFWLRVADPHGGNNWKPVLTNYEEYPIVAGHWYRIRVVWNSDKVGEIPCDIYVDDEGTDGVDTDEIWAGFANCTDTNQSLLAENQRLFEGDEILGGDGSIHIGATANQTLLFNGLIDWIRADLDADFGPPILLRELTLEPPASGRLGVLLRWVTDPGEAIVVGYRIEKRLGALPARGSRCTRTLSDALGAGWFTIAELPASEVSFYDSEGSPGSEYRLFVVNHLGEESLLGKVGVPMRPPSPAVAAWPLPYSRDVMNISFATLGGANGIGKGEVEISIFDVAGRRIRTVTRGLFPAGVHQTKWDGRDDRGSRVAPGVYFLRLATNGENDARKLVVLP